MGVIVRVSFFFLFEGESSNFNSCIPRSSKLCFRVLGLLMFLFYVLWDVGGVMY